MRVETEKILEILMEAKGPLTAAEIHKALGTKYTFQQVQEAVSRLSSHHPLGIVVRLNSHAGKGSVQQYRLLTWGVGNLEDAA